DAFSKHLQKALENKPDANTLIQMVYTFFKDFPETLKNEEFKASLYTKLNELLSYEEITDAQKLQVHFFLEDLSPQKESAIVADLIKNSQNIEEVIQEIQIHSFKKRTLVEARALRPDWKSIFLNMIFVVDQSALRDYILSELNEEETSDELKAKLEELLLYPSRHPEALIWYFQKVTSQPKAIFADSLGKSRFFEAFLILLSHIEHNNDYRDLVKKIHTILSNGRYAIIRQIMQTASLDEVKEFLLLATKCHSLSDHDIKIFHSLAEVVHPSLAKTKKKDTASQDSQIIWTTREGYQKLQQRIQQIATVDTVENAKEIEVARGHGDLRENAEFKAALERRDRQQAEVKLLSEQLNRARILSKEDISTDEVGIGSVVECKSPKGEVVTYTLLGPWDADPEKNILSFQSKLAQTMSGLKVGNSFKFQGEEFIITGIHGASV
ncbi:MAG: GreA/GreB family elongation factor, partial [Chlamydiota bacterium]